MNDRQPHQMSHLAGQLRALARGSEPTGRIPLLAVAAHLDQAGAAVAAATAAEDVTVDVLEEAAATCDLLTFALGKSAAEDHLPTNAQAARTQARLALMTSRDLLTAVREEGNVTPEAVAR